MCVLVHPVPGSRKSVRLVIPSRRIARGIARRRSKSRPVAHGARGRAGGTQPPEWGQ